ncbi:MAG TPA: ParB/RepB/Spo0J family partition protein [Acidothermaceae bacterium]|jgi:ParB family chromosome partitioning protein
MSTRRGGLGRGLGALIPTTPTIDRPRPAGGEPEPDPAHTAIANTQPRVIRLSDEETLLAVPGARFAELSVDDIAPNPKQPRQVFDEAALAELAHSLREVGFLQPVVVRPAGAGYELVMGERRLRAAQQAGFTTIPAIIRDTNDDALLRDALLENLHREQLNPLEEGAAYAQLLDEFGATHEELAKRIGRSRSQVSNTIRLLNLPPSVQRKVAAGVLSAGHARALLGLDDAVAQERLAQRIVAEGLSVRAVEEIVAVGDGESGRRRAPRAGRQRAAGLDELAAGLSDHFETRVRVDLGRSRGKITIEFASVDDLERIVAAMAPTLATHKNATHKNSASQPVD